MKTRVIHINRAPGHFRSDPQYIYIGRGSPWGNPFRIGDPMNDGGGRLTRDDVISLFKTHTLPGLMDKIHLLQGKILVCFCKPQDCHGDCYIEALVRMSGDCPCEPEACHGDSLVATLDE